MLITENILGHGVIGLSEVLQMGRFWGIKHCWNRCSIPANRRGWLPALASSNECTFHVHARFPLLPCILIMLLHIISRYPTFCPSTSMLTPDVVLLYGGSHCSGYLL